MSEPRHPHRMRIVLCSLTGFANAIIPALIRLGHRPCVVTRRERGPFPHYECPNVLTLVEDYQLPFRFDLDQQTVERCDLLLVATFHQIIPPTLYRLARHAVNLHPSLLPKYRGPNPFHWVLANGENETGITAHALSERCDTGDIYAQWRLPILPYETEGILRRRLAELAAFAATEIVSTIERAVLVGSPQDEALATYYPHPMVNGSLEKQNG